MRVRLFVAIPILLVGCADAFSAHPQVAARVDGQELTVRRLAELMVLGQPLPLTEQVGEELARHWVDVAALANRLAMGDSLWDSTFVKETMWLNLQQMSISRFRQAVGREGLSVTPAVVDSAYRVGEHRVIAHVLKTIPAGSTVEYRRAKQSEANAIYERLRNGGSWADANALSDDSIAVTANGNLGVLSRGVAVPRFENVAYALEPGEISPPVETQFGYHIIFRPTLENVRPQFTGFVAQALRSRIDSTYSARIMTEVEIRVAQDAPAKLRRIAADPFKPHPTTDAVVTYSGGRVSSERFAEYLRLLAPETHREMTTGDAQNLGEFALGVGLQEVLAKKADSAQIVMSDSVMGAITESYREELRDLWQLFGLLPDSVLAPNATPEHNATRLVNKYLDAAVSRQTPITPVPPFLTAKLLQDVEWEINQRAVTASVQMAQRLQLSSSDSIPAVNP